MSATPTSNNQLSILYLILLFELFECEKQRTRNWSNFDQSFFKFDAIEE